MACSFVNFAIGGDIANGNGHDRLFRRRRRDIPGADISRAMQPDKFGYA